MKSATTSGHAARTRSSSRSTRSSIAGGIELVIEFDAQRGHDLCGRKVHPNEPVHLADVGIIAREALRARNEFRHGDEAVSHHRCVNGPDSSRSSRHEANPSQHPGPNPHTAKWPMRKNEDAEKAHLGLGRSLISQKPGASRQSSLGLQPRTRVARPIRCACNVGCRGSVAAGRLPRVGCLGFSLCSIAGDIKRSR
jgi:hypothetical protein